MKEGIPVPGTPSETMRNISSADNFCTWGLLTILGARWLPVPSSPWQPTQFEPKICLPRELLIERVLDAGLERDCCEDATSTPTKNTPINTIADTIEKFRNLISRLVNSSASLRSLHELRVQIRADWHALVITRTKSYVM